MWNASHFQERPRIPLLRSHFRRTYTLQYINTLIHFQALYDGHCFLTKCNSIGTLLYYLIYLLIHSSFSIHPSSYSSVTKQIVAKFVCFKKNCLKCKCSVSAQISRASFIFFHRAWVFESSQLLLLNRLSLRFISISDATTLGEPSLIYLKNERQFFGFYFQ